MKCESAVTNARFAALHGLLVALFPLADARSTPQIARSSRAAMVLAAQQRRASVCGSAAALRSDSVPAVSPSPLHCFRSPTADRSLIKEICHQPKNFFELQAVGGTCPRESLTR
jgi:hypothetical protein